MFSSQAGEVLYNDAVDLAIGNVLHHFLKRRTVKNDTAITIVDFFGYDLDVRISFNEVLNQLPLVGNAVALAGAIICVRQTNVSCRLISRFSVFILFHTHRSTLLEKERGCRLP